MRLAIYALCTFGASSGTAFAQMAPPPPAQTVSPSQSNGAPPPAATPEEKEDSGRNLEILWARGELGYSKVALAAMSGAEADIGLKSQTSSGSNWGVSGGVRFVALTAGAEVKRFITPDYSLWNVGALVGLNVPIGRFDPSITLRGGYMFSSKLDTSNFANSVAGAPITQSEMKGFDAGVGIGLDYYVFNALSVGVGGDARVAYLTRGTAPKPAGFDQLPASVQSQILASPLYQAQSVSVGLLGSVGLRLGLHYGI